MHLEKRDNMGFLIPPSAIVLLVMLGAGCLVCCGYAVWRLMEGSEGATGFKPRTVEQEQYMADVRTRNMEALAYGVRQSRFGPKRKADMR